ncbi:MAG TPA: hypothetical protein VJU61_15020 [Polyangiaceae bacterium]|nr:hypothetical protein [Polyangiaceae bacterium]
MSRPRSHLRERVLAAFLSSGVLGGCADDADSDPLRPSYPSLAVVSGCESEKYQVCDVLDSDCQASIFATMKCLRRMPDGVLPELRVITQEERRAELSEALAPEPEDVVQRDAEERAFSMLGLAQPGDFAPASVVDLFTETVPAYYSFETGTVTLIEPEGEPREPGQLTLTLAHEFAHALQDQDVDLAGLLQNTTTFDAHLARISLVEGEAEMLESFFAATLWGFSDNPDFRQRYTSWLDDAESSYGNTSPLLVSQRYVPYSYGARFVYNVYAEGGMDAVRARFSDLPGSVLPILLSADQLEEPPIESLAERSAPPGLDGFELLVSDTLGPWILSKFLERGMFDPGPQALVASWRADRFFVYAAPDGPVAALWTLRFEDAAAAEQLLGALGQGRNVKNAIGRAFATVSERELTLGVVEDSLTFDDWSAAAEEAQRVWREAPPAARAPRTPSRPVAPRLSATRFSAPWLGRELSAQSVPGWASP